MSEYQGVTPPNSVEAEQSVLGAMLQDSNAVLQAAESLLPEDFYQPQHKEIFDAMPYIMMAKTTTYTVPINPVLLKPRSSV